MSIVRVGLCLAAALVFWSLRVEASLAADSYSMTTIDYPDAKATFATGINNRGDIVGYYRVGTTRHAMFIRDGAFITPTDILATNWSEASKSNDRGDVVGRYVDEDGILHGFLASGRDYALTLLDYPGSNDTRPRAINESGTVVGFWCNAEGCHGFIWDKGDFSILDVEGAANTYLTGINERGDIVGSWDDGSTTHGFVFSKGQFSSIDAPSPAVAGGVTGTELLDINALGHIIGVYYDADGVGHGFLKEGQTFTPIDHPDGGGGTAVYGINSAGQIVGAYACPGQTARHGFLGQPDNKKKP